MKTFHTPIPKFLNVRHKLFNWKVLLPSYSVNKHLNCIYLVVLVTKFADNNLTFREFLSSAYVEINGILFWF